MWRVSLFFDTIFLKAWTYESFWFPRKCILICLDIYQKTILRNSLNVVFFQKTRLYIWCYFASKRILIYDTLSWKTRHKSWGRTLSGGQTVNVNVLCCALGKLNLSAGLSSTSHCGAGIPSGWEADEYLSFFHTALIYTTPSTERSWAPGSRHPRPSWTSQRNKVIWGKHYRTFLHIVDFNGGQRLERQNIVSVQLSTIPAEE